MTRPAGQARLRLGVNVDHVATLRQARGTPYPDPVDAARLCLRAGAQSITVHLREDRRHIQDDDVRRLAADASVPLNLEMANVPDIVRLACELRPEEVCLVPERRAERTTEGGLDAVGQFADLQPAVTALGGAGIRVSLFVAAEPAHLDAAARLGAPVVELHTGRYCDLVTEGRKDEARAELDRLIAGARSAHARGLQVNAGHGINLDNLPGILELPHLDTLNIGHSLVARAVFAGLETAVREMLAGMAAYRGGRP